MGTSSSGLHWGRHCRRQSQSLVQLYNNVSSLYSSVLYETVVALSLLLYSDQLRLKLINLFLIVVNLIIIIIIIILLSTMDILTVYSR